MCKQVIPASDVQNRAAPIPKKVARCAWTFKCNSFAPYVQVNTAQSLKSVPKKKEKFGQDRVYHCVTSLLLFTTMTKRSGTEDKNCCKFWKWNSFPFLLDARLQLLNSPRSLLLYFFLLFHNGRQVWTAGKDSLVPALFYYESHAVVTRADCGLALSRWNKQERPWKSHCLSGWKRMLSQILHF